MKLSARIASALLLASTTLVMASVSPSAPQPDVSDVMSKVLQDYPGKSVSVLAVKYPPGAVEPMHRHDAHAFVYVLEGSIVMAVEGGEETTLLPGQVFYEGPADLHTVGRNASQTEPAKFVVFLLKKADAPVFLPADRP